jgi:hypothetical protein
MKDPQIFRQENSNPYAQGHQLVNTQPMKKEQLASRPGSALALVQPLFSEGEIIFVNPELSGEPGDYVVVESGAGGPEGALVRQLKETGGQAILHPLDRRHEDLPKTKHQRIVGRVVRLRKNL